MNDRTIPPAAVADMLLPEFAELGMSAPVDMGPLEATVTLLGTMKFPDVEALTRALESVYGTVVALTQPKPEEPAPVELKPAVPIRKSVTQDAIICLEDGKPFKSLKRHIRTHYNLTPEQYREKWGLPADYPMVAPSYSATRSSLAKTNGLGLKR